MGTHRAKGRKQAGINLQHSDGASAGDLVTVPMYNSIETEWGSGIGIVIARRPVEIVDSFLVLTTDTRGNPFVVEIGDLEIVRKLSWNDWSCLLKR